MCTVYVAYMLYAVAYMLIYACIYVKISHINVTSHHICVEKCRDQSWIYQKNGNIIERKLLFSNTIEIRTKLLLKTRIE